MFHYVMCWALYSKAGNYLFVICSKIKTVQNVWIFVGKQTKQDHEALVWQFFENQEALVELKLKHLLAINPFP